MIEPKTMAHFEQHMRVMLRAIADQDPEGQAAIANMMRDAATNGVRQAVGEGRKRNGWSWAQLGGAFGVRPFNAQKRLDPARRPEGEDARDWKVAK